MVIDEIVADALFQEIWPLGVPIRDEIAFGALAPGDRAIVLARLAAVWRAAQGGNLSELANSVGLKRAAFYNLRRSWEVHSLAGVIPGATRRGRRLSVADNDPLRSHARDLIRRSRTGERNVDLARQLVGSAPDVGPAHPSPAELQRAERIVQHERLALAMDAGYLKSAYGAGLLIEITGVQLVLDAAESLSLVAVFVMEMGSGLVLGVRIGSGDDVADMELRAVMDAKEQLRFLRVDRMIPGRLPDCQLILPPSRSIPTADLKQLEAVAGRLTVQQYDFNRRGALLPQIVGPRIGRLGICTRPVIRNADGGLRSGKELAHSTMELAEAFVEREIFWHNEPIFEAMARTGLADVELQATGNLTAILDAVVDVLTD